MEQQSPQSIMFDLQSKISSLETKVKLNEQNFFNLQERMQLISTNFLDLKKELRERADNITEETREIESTIKDLRSKISKLESQAASAPKAEYSESVKKFPAPMAALTTEMSSEDAKNALDSVLKKLGG